MRKVMLLVLSCAAARAQLSEKATWAVEAQNRYAIKPNITYGVQNNFETKLDVYQRRDTTGPQPTIVYIHGGGWTGGSKETSVMSLFPYFEMGWNVVNVEYRLEKSRPLPPRSRIACAHCAGSACMRRNTTSIPRNSSSPANPPEDILLSPPA